MVFVLGYRNSGSGGRDGGCASRKVGSQWCLWGRNGSSGSMNSGHGGKDAGCAGRKFGYGGKCGVMG